MKKNEASFVNIQSTFFWTKLLLTWSTTVCIEHTSVRCLYHLYVFLSFLCHNKCQYIPQRLNQITWMRSLKYHWHRCKSGASTDSCGTPHVSFWLQKLKLWTKNYCLLLSRWEQNENKFLASNSSRFFRMIWRLTIKLDDLLKIKMSNVFLTHSVKLNSAWFMEWQAKKPNWRL